MSNAKPKTLLNYFSNNAGSDKKREREESTPSSPAKSQRSKTEGPSNDETTAAAAPAVVMAVTHPVIVSPSRRKAAASGSQMGASSPASAKASSATNDANASDSAGSLESHLEEPSWRALLGNEFKKPYFRSLMTFVEGEMQRHRIFPPRNLVFSALNACPVDSIKVVILGQDPYHGAGQAHGLAFSVQRGIAPPPSLKNIFKVAKEDVGIPTPTHGDLSNWSKQGVLLLNTCLTVRSGQAFSHQGKGWEDFVDCIIRQLAARNDSLVFILWGKPAHLRCKNIDRSKHHIITSSHPSPLGAAKTDEPFMKSRCFSRCNERLRAIGKKEIDWSIPN